MTPERIAEVRKILSGMNERSQLFPITVGDLNSLLAALEESQQQNNEWQEEAKQWRDEFVSKNDELAEAQQTMARQQEVLEFYANQEHWELPSFGRGQSKVTSDRGSKARELLKEGSDKT